MYKKLNRPAEGLERDANGHRTGFKCQIKVRKPMSKEGFKKFHPNYRLKVRRTTWSYYSSSKAIGLDNGLPIPIMANNKVMAEWMINNFILASGEVYSVHGYTAGKTATGSKLTRSLAIIEVHDTDTLKYTVKNFGRMNRYWFRTSQKKKVGGSK